MCNQLNYVFSGALTMLKKCGGAQCYIEKIQPYIESYLKSDSNKVLIIDGARQIGKTFYYTPRWAAAL